VIRHVGKRVDERHLGFATAKLVLQGERGVETGVSATDDENFGHEISC
jgi:hypothetical protein